MSDERAAWRAAIHEAAHCVACWALDIRIETVELYQRGGGTTRAHLFANTKSPVTYDEAHGALVVLSAGAAAERHAFGAAELSADDRTSMTNMLQPFKIASDAERAWRRRARREARELVQANWRQIELVAGELMRRGAIAGDEVTRLLGGPAHVTVRYRDGKVGSAGANAKRDASVGEVLLPVVNPNGNKVLGEVRKRGRRFEAIRNGELVGTFSNLGAAARAV